MRPLRLELEGLRSYRTRQEIDFSDRNLVAIVGNTGAGKSSILEAIVYALYNASTWDERSVEALIADGQTKMEVVFDFETGGRTWRVRRATNRGGYPPSQHKLSCLSDETVPPLNHERAIKKEISRILGLTYDAFKSAILLPQGQFQALLKAKDRTAILKEVFRLDVQVDAIRTGASEALERIVGQLDAASATRSKLLPDPEAAGREAEERRRSAEGRLEAAHDVARRHDEWKAEAEKAATESTTLGRLRARLEDALQDDAAVLAELVTVQEELRSRRQQLQQQHSQSSTAAQELAASLEAAERGGEGLSALSAAEVVLQGLETDLPAIATEAVRLQDENEATAQDAAALDAAAMRTGELADAVTESERKLREAAASVEETRRLYSEAALRLATARKAREEAADADRQVGEARSQLLSAASALAAQYREVLAEQPPVPKRKAAEIDASAALEILDVEIDRARERLDERHERAARAVAELAAAIQEPEARGEGLSPLSAAESVLGRLKTDLPAIASDAQRILDEQKGIDGEAASLEAAGGRLPELAGVVESVQKQLQQAQVALGEAVETQNHVKILLADARRAERELASAEKELSAERAQLEPLEEEVQLRAAAYRDAEERAQVALAEYEAAQRLHAAAHASSGLSAGDACPICTRALPDGFVPPRGDEGVAQARYEEAREVAAQADRLRLQAESQRDAAGGVVRDKDAVAVRRRDEARAALGILRQHLPSADLAAGDVALLAPLAEAERDRRAQQDAAQTGRDDAVRQHHEYEASLVAREKTLNERRRRHRQDADALKDRTRLIERERMSIPAAYRPAPAATADVLDGARDGIRARLAELQSLKERHERAASARDEVSNARSAAVRQQTQVDALRAALRAKESATVERRHEAEQAIVKVRELLPVVDPDAGDANLAPLVETGNTRRRAQDAAQKAHDEARARLQEHQLQLAAERKRLEDRRGRHSRDGKALAERVRIAERRRQSLPDAYRPPAEAAVTGVQETRTRVRGRLDALRELKGRQERAAKARDDTNRALSALADEEAKRVMARERDTWSRVRVLWDRAVESGVDMDALPSVDAPLSDRGRWASALEERTRGRIHELEKRAREANAAASRGMVEQARLLAAAGYASHEDLAKALAELAAERLAAQTDERRARGQVPLARALEDRIGPATALRDALMALTKLLNDQKFVRFVIERRQQALLAVASTILRSMTRNRYGFAADFRVVDMVTSQARPVETLSGGETFLASLALALGLVELAGRGGGRVDSLILDEGFASLDTAALTCALDELERRAGTGKLVALVSHLGAVADMAPEVLYVLQKDGSSVARWRSQTEDDPELEMVDARLHRS